MPPRRAQHLDVVYNHFGPSDLDLWQFDGWSENEKGGIYFYNNWKSETPWGDTRPDYGRGEVRQFIRDNALFWLEEYGLDGLRFDMTLYIRNVRGNEEDPGDTIAEGWSLMQWVNGEIATRFPGRIAIAEDLRNKAALTAPVEAGGAAFGEQWDSQFVHPIREVLIAPDDAHRHMGTVAHALAHHYNGDPFERVIYTESHDEVANGKARIPHEIAPGDPAHWAAQKRSTLGAALVLTAPGIPMLFQGQEFLQGECSGTPCRSTGTKARSYAASSGSGAT
jgi:1,4-alpha-glucan branching enzyme